MCDYVNKSCCRFAELNTNYEGELLSFQNVFSVLIFSKLLKFNIIDYICQLIQHAVIDVHQKSLWCGV